MRASRHDLTINSRSGRAALVFAASLWLSLTACDSNEDQAFSRGYAAYQQGDFKAAMGIWNPLAEAGDARAQYNLGMIYYEGRGVPRDVAQAILLWRKAADQGHLRARHNLALALIFGEGRQQDYAAAIDNLKITAKAGFTNSQYSRGKMLLEGLGAAMRFRKAAEGGHAGAQRDLASRLAEGKGIARDEGAALKWALIAAGQGMDEAA